MPLGIPLGAVFAGIFVLIILSSVCTYLMRARVQRHNQAIPGYAEEHIRISQQRIVTLNYMQAGMLRSQNANAAQNAQIQNTIAWSNAQPSF
jgi:hypothetical protein